MSDTDQHVLRIAGFKMEPTTAFDKADFGAGVIGVRKFGPITLSGHFVDQPVTQTFNLSRQNVRRIGWLGRGKVGLWFQMRKHPLIAVPINGSITLMGQRRYRAHLRKLMPIRSKAIGRATQ